MSLVTIAVLLVVLSPQKSAELPLRMEIRCVEIGLRANDSSAEGIVSSLFVVEAEAGPNVPLAGALETCWRIGLGCMGEKAQATCCPYSKPTTHSSNVGRLDWSVLENLQRLERARAACENAEIQRRLGKRIRAAQLYEEVMRLCPGSRYEAMAARRLHDIYVQMAHQSVRSMAEEEQDRTPPRK